MICFGYNEDYNRCKRLEESICKGNVLNLHVIPASMNALETTALTEKQPKEGPGFRKQPGKMNHGSSES